MTMGKVMEGGRESLMGCDCGRWMWDRDIIAEVGVNDGADFTLISDLGMWVLCPIITLCRESLVDKL